ncbi:MAG: M15 family metallopeptidase, partial [Spirochaetales bacterium]
DFNDDWMLVPQEDIWTPPQQVVKVFEKYGFIWGGVWDIYDTMHFEYKPECIALNRYILYEGNL